jgi:hypothetical protein
MRTLRHSGSIAAPALRTHALCVLAVMSLLAVRCRESPTAPGPPSVPEIKGFAYTSFNRTGFTQGGSRNAVGELQAQIRNTWIALTIFEYQTSPTSYDIAPNTTGLNPLTATAWPTSSSEEDLREGVREAREAQMHILLKPQIDLYSGDWRAAIRPDMSGQWFQAYTEMMVKFARLAQELHVEMLCMGTEYAVATQSIYTPRWKTLIATLRRVYTGQLVYAANWSGAYAYGVSRPEYEQIEFWEDLDYIGVDLYVPLTGAREDTAPAFDDAVALTSTWAQGLRALSSRTYQPVIVTEIGIQSVKGALAAPWDYALGAEPGAVEDTGVQEFYYRVMIDALGKQPWCAGLFWWNWESVPTPNEATNYTPRNKPAATTLRTWYSGAGALASR